VSADLIHQFYQAFQRKDAEAMAGCYHPEVEFSDPVFPSLKGERAGHMWRMLCQRGKDLAVVYRDVEADGERGRAHWDATYTYSASGRPVENRVDATFEFRDGKIVRHVDRFDLYRWTRMALGPSMIVLGLLPPVRAKIRARAASALEEWMRRR
jgi:ketosteroid isomerase-like protein